jgi:hypothetical protein
VDAGAARLGGLGDGRKPLRAGTAAIEADERVAAVDRDGWAVEKLLDRLALGRDA